MSNSKYKRYGLFLYYLLKIISKTMRKKIITQKEINYSDSYICAFWHNKLVGVSVALQNSFEKRVCLASPSKDGELIAVPLEKMGFELVRGSSDKDSIKSLLKMVKMVKNGYSAGTPVDGPKGPIYEVKQGMIYLAQKSEAPLIPIGVAFSKKWIFNKTWDRFQLPKPFSKMVCLLGEPITIPKDADLEEYSIIVKNRIFELEKEAEERLKNS